MIKIAKEYRFEMSHRLPEHRGACKNIHGHSYKLKVWIIGELNESGMILDFYDFDEIILPIINKLDHGFLCDYQDIIMINFLKENNFKYFILQSRTTSENITLFLLEEMRKEFSKFNNIKKIGIRFSETESSYAEAECDI